MGEMRARHEFCRLDPQGQTRRIAPRFNVTLAGFVASDLGIAMSLADQRIAGVVKNELVDFSFNRDAREKLDSIRWEAFDAQLKARRRAP